jgi:ribosomal protein S18 acetylase RimI-like enzyme
MQIRQATPADSAAIASVAYATGFFGESAARYFPDERLFADLWVAPYLAAGARGCSFVAVREGEVIGYVLGSSDTIGYRQRMVKFLRVILQRLAAGRYRQWRGCLPYLLRLLLFPARFASLWRYPAHLHINLLARARGQGAGRKLLNHTVQCCREQQLPGIQLSTTTENRAALRLYESCGFRILKSYRSGLWRPWLGRVTTHLTLVLDLGNEPAQRG